MSNGLDVIDADIRLGFADEIQKDDKFLLHPTQFPSKTGGEPVWLDPVVPKISTLKCRLCEEPLSFIMQIYAPVDGADHAYHRSLYLFGCLACNHSFKCLRAQLPEFNDVYAPESAPDSPRGAKPFADEFDKKHIITKPAVRSNVEEYLIAVEEEPTSENEEDDDDEEEDSEDESDDELDVTEEERQRTLALQKKYEETGGIEMDETEEEAWEKLQKENTHEDAQDKVFKAFRKRCSRAPDQIMRYQRNGEPLWFATYGMPANPPASCCPYCQGPRTFEFQVQPQMLSTVTGLEESDFALLVVYTCQNSCKVEGNGEFGNYAEEFVYKQKENANENVAKAQ